MKHVSLSSSLYQLRGILKAAIDHCDAIQEPSAEIRSAITDYSLSCLSIEKVIELVGSSKTLNNPAAHHGRPLEQHLHDAQIAGRNIRDATATYHYACLGPKARTAANRFHDFTKCLLSNLSRIVAALNSAILLISM